MGDDPDRQGGWAIGREERNQFRVVLADRCLAVADADACAHGGQQSEIVVAFQDRMQGQGGQFWDAGNVGGGGDEIVFRLRVLAVGPARRLQWVGRLWNMPGLFTGTHRFLLHATDRGTQLRQSEQFSGLLLWFYDVAPLAAAFGRMNEAAEAAGRTSGRLKPFAKKNRPEGRFSEGTAGGTFTQP